MASQLNAEMKKLQGGEHAEINYKLNFKTFFANTIDQLVIESGEYDSKAKELMTIQLCQSFQVRKATDINNFCIVRRF